MQEEFDKKEQAPVNLPFQMNAWSALNKGQKIAIISLAVFVLFLIIAWIYQFKKSLSDPFTYKGPKEEQSAVVADPALAEQDALKKKDTDSDGLSDWDELNVYKTSPYLEDTDGDGTKDGDEVKASSDPNCPEGKECFSSTTIAEKLSGPNGATGASGVLKTDNSRNVSSSTDNSESLSKLLQGGLDAVELRKLLKDSGMDERMLNQLTDQELLSSYQELIKQQTTSN